MGETLNNPCNKHETLYHVTRVCVSDYFCGVIFVTLQRFLFQLPKNRGMVCPSQRSTGLGRGQVSQD